MLINAEDLDTSPPEWLVDQLIPRVGVGFGFGPSYIGKSLVFGQELGLAVANRKRFFGREVVHGSVVYCLGEGLGDAGVRLKGRRVREQQDRTAKAAQIAAKDGPDAAQAWYAAQPPYTDERMIIRPSPFVIPAGHQGEPTKSLRQAATEIGQVPDLELVILDAAADFTGGLSLANDTSANRFMLGMKWLAAELDCVIFAIAHPNQKSTLPGTRLYASSDFVIGIEPDPESPDGSTAATVISQKVKQGRLFDPFSYVIEPVAWHEPATDPETGQELPGEPPVLTTTVTVRLREDDQAGHGGLRLPGSGTRAGVPLPEAVEVPARPRKRNGIRVVRPARTPAAPVPVTAPGPAPEPDPELAARLIPGLLSGDCPECQAKPRAGCQPGGAEYAVLAQRPLVLCHIARMAERIAAGAVPEDDAMALVAGQSAPAEDLTAAATA